jgi:Sigma-70 region 2
MRLSTTTPTSEAIEDLYRRRFGAFVRTSYAITRDTDSARDVVQDAFALAIRRRSTLRRETSLESWVWRIVVTRDDPVARDRPPLGRRAASRPARHRPKTANRRARARRRCGADSCDRRAAVRPVTAHGGLRTRKQFRAPPCCGFLGDPHARAPAGRTAPGRAPVRRGACTGSSTSIPRRGRQ